MWQESRLLERLQIYATALFAVIGPAVVVYAVKQRQANISKSEAIVLPPSAYVEQSWTQPWTSLLHNGLESNVFDLEPRFAQACSGQSNLNTDDELAQGIQNQDFALVQNTIHLQRVSQQSQEPCPDVPCKSAAPAQKGSDAKHFVKNDLAADIHDIDLVVGHLVDMATDRHQTSTKSWQDLQHLRSANDDASLLDLQTTEPLVATGDEVFVRPNAGGPPDEVKFGLYAKEFYRASMVAHEFIVDMITTLQWLDPRTTRLIPQKVKVLTLSQENARQRLWMPDIEITNRGIRGYEKISTSISINRDGLVTKVERSLAVIKNKFHVEAFPFDDQLLTVTIASTALMSDEVILANIVDPGVSGVSNTLFAGSEFVLKSVATSSFEEDESSMAKSRGQLQIYVHRRINKYLQTHLFPSILLLTISYGTFWLPFIPQFATPRLALSILALLSVLTLSLKTSDQLAPEAPFCWNGLFDQTLQWLMCLTVILNIFSELVFHSMKLEDLGRKINNGCKIFWLLLAMTNICVVFSSTSGKLLAEQAWATRAVLLSSAFFFAMWSYTHVRSQHK